MSEAAAAEKRKADANEEGDENGLGLSCSLDDEGEPPLAKHACVNSPLYNVEEIDAVVAGAQAAAAAVRDAPACAGPVMTEVPSDLPVPAGPACAACPAAPADDSVGSTLRLAPSMSRGAGACEPLAAAPPGGGRGGLGAKCDAPPPSVPDSPA